MLGDLRLLGTQMPPAVPQPAAPPPNPKIPCRTRKASHLSQGLYFWLCRPAPYASHLLTGSRLLQPQIRVLGACQLQPAVHLARLLLCGGGDTSPQARPLRRMRPTHLPLPPPPWVLSVGPPAAARGARWQRWWFFPGAVCAACETTPWLACLSSHVENPLAQLPCGSSRLSS